MMTIRWFLLFPAVAAAACGFECAEGTAEVDGACVPTYPEVHCADGTVERDGRCSPAYPMRDCGPMTVERDGTCVAAPDVATCGPSTVRRGDECVRLRSLTVALPFPSGMSVEVTQGAHGGFTHHGLSAYAIDFAVLEGTLVVAARGGVVIRSRADSDVGCADPSCADQANYVTIDHGDGTFGHYFHLQRDGVLVDLFDTVCAGQPIGRSGNTGFSSGPHLHFEVGDLYGQSIPVSFETTLPESSDLYSHGRFTSTNAETTSCPPIAPSTCGEDVFAHRGVILDAGFPCSVVERDRDYALSGTSGVPGGGMVFHVWSDVARDWISRCADVEADGRFAVRLRFPSADHRQRETRLEVAAVQRNCPAWPGFSARVRLSLAN